MGDIFIGAAAAESIANKANELNNSQTQYPTCYAVTQALSGVTGGGGFTPYCANSGNVDINGDADLIAGVDAEVSFKVGGSYPVLTLTGADNSRFERGSLTTVDVTEYADGTYNVFADKTSEEYLANIVYRQNTEPTSLTSGDVWVDTSIEPLKVKKYSGSTWAEYNKIPIGSFTVASGSVTAVSTFPYNTNGTFNKLIESYSASGGQNNYIIEWRYSSYSHTFCKYAIQNGEGNATSTENALKFYQNFKDSNSYIFLIDVGRGISSIKKIGYKQKSADGVTVMIETSGGYYSWRAEGWVN